MAGIRSGNSLKVAIAAAVVAAAVAAGLAAHGGGNRAKAQPPPLTLRAIDNFDDPVHVAHAPLRPRLLYVVERQGLIRVLRKGRKLARPFLNIRSRVRSLGSEAGLLSVAFDPEYPRKRRFFVFYVNKDGDIQVDRFRSRPGRPERTRRRSRRTIIRIAHDAHHHFGGQLQFGPGGLLYMATGDGSSGSDTLGNAQNINSLLGKLLRIRPRPKGGHGSPRSNPFVGRTGRNQIYSLGFRNPWGFSFDRRTGDISIADVGEKRWEEINHVTRAEARGANFGWSCREGPEEFVRAPEACAGRDRSEFTDPIHAYPTFDRPECAVIGGYVARGRRAPGALTGRYVYGDLCSGELRSLNPNAADPSVTDRTTGLNVSVLTSFGEGGRGALYASSQNGPVYQIVSR